MDTMTEQRINATDLQDRSHWQMPIMSDNSDGKMQSNLPRSLH